VQALKLVGWIAGGAFGSCLMLWSGLGVRHAIALLRAAPPTGSKEPSTRLEQIFAQYLSRARGWIVVFSAALVGTAISDFDRDPHRGLGRMLGLFLLVLAVLIFVCGASIGLAGWRVASNSGFGSRSHDGAELLLSCVITGLALAVALGLSAAALL
jgi:hypothetical protein